MSFKKCIIGQVLLVLNGLSNKIAQIPQTFLIDKLILFEEIGL